jgi:putative two-component system response regulator
MAEAARVLYSIEPPGGGADSLGPGGAPGLPPGPASRRTPDAFVQTRPLLCAADLRLPGCPETPRAARVRALMKLATSMNGETTAHVRQVGLYAAALAAAAGWHPRHVRQLRLAAPLHDIGKAGLNPRILVKPGPLTSAEMDTVRTHPVLGYDLIGSGALDPMLTLARTVALTHHERWDGAGYPQGLAGTRIPEAGRITGIADVYDALVSRRSYRDALPSAEARQIMARDRGAAFEPRLLDIFFALLDAPAHTG